MPAPDRIPTWATDGGAVINEPSTGKAATGWEVGEIPPAGTFNWLFGKIGEWITYFVAEFVLRTRRYESLHAAIDDDGMANGAIFTVAASPAAPLGDEQWGIVVDDDGADGYSAFDVATDGRYVYVLSALGVTGYDRDDGSRIWRSSTTGTWVPGRGQVDTDGEYVVACNSHSAANVACFPVEVVDDTADADGFFDNPADWTYNHASGLIRCVWVGGGIVFAAGEADSSSDTLVAIDVTDGSVLHTYAGGAEIVAMTVRQVSATVWDLYLGVTWTDVDDVGVATPLRRIRYTAGSGFGSIVGIPCRPYGLPTDMVWTPDALVVTTTPATTYEIDLTAALADDGLVGADTIQVISSGTVIAEYTFGSNTEPIEPAKIGAALVADWLANVDAGAQKAKMWLFELRGHKLVIMAASPYPHTVSSVDQVLSVDQTNPASGITALSTGLCVFGLDPHTGDLLWACSPWGSRLDQFGHLVIVDSDARTAAANTVTYDGRVVWVGGPGADGFQLARLNPANGTILNRLPEGTGAEVNALAADGVDLFVGSEVTFGAGDESLYRLIGGQTPREYVRTTPGTAIGPVLRGFATPVD